MASGVQWIEGGRPWSLRPLLTARARTAPRRCPGAGEFGNATGFGHWVLRHGLRRRRKAHMACAGSNQLTQLWLREETGSQPDGRCTSGGRCSSRRTSYRRGRAQRRHRSPRVLQLELARQVHGCTGEGARGERAFAPKPPPERSRPCAMTVHKAQSSQAAHAVLLPAPTRRLLTRELLYTAVTRAQQDRAGSSARGR